MVLLAGIDYSTKPFLENMKSPIHATSHASTALDNGFASLSKFQLHGTIAAGDGFVFRMVNWDLF
jgi:hypothetical protein